MQTVKYTIAQEWAFRQVTSRWYIQAIGSVWYYKANDYIRPFGCGDSFDDCYMGSVTDGVPIVPSTSDAT